MPTRSLKDCTRSTTRRHAQRKLLRPDKGGGARSKPRQHFRALTTTNLSPWRDQTPATQTITRLDAHDLFLLVPTVRILSTNSTAPRSWLHSAKPHEAEAGWTAMNY